MELSIVIPTKDRGEIFDETLNSVIQAIDSLDAELIVVNDSKTSVPAVPNHPKVRLINNEKGGVASARNRGAKAAAGDVLLFVDDDIIVSEASLRHVIKLHEEFSDGCFNLNWIYPHRLASQLQHQQFGRFMERYNMTSFKGWYADDSWKDFQLFRSKSVASFHLSISRTNFQKTGGYNEEFPHAGFEDYDFPERIRRCNIVPYIDTRVTVFHNEADRTSVENWLNGQMRRATTRRVAVGLGYRELSLHYGIIKKMLLHIVMAFSNLITSLLKMIPNRTLFDPVYFKLVNILLAARIYKGYTSAKKE